MMRILYLCHLDPATCDYPLFLAEEWEKIGHEVHLLPYDIEYTNNITAKFWDSLGRGDEDLRLAFLERRIVSVCQQRRPEVLILGAQFLTPKGVKRLREKFGCCVGMVIGYNNLLDWETAALTRTSDFVIVHDTYLIPIIRGVRYGKNPNVLFMMCMANPKEHQPLDLSEEDRQQYGGDVAFIGGIGDNRVEALRRLTGYDLRIWGGHWQKAPDLTPFFRNEPVYGLKKTKIYNAAKIVLNIEDDEKQINAISNRIPEVLACGGFILTDWHKDLELTPLVEGESIVCYRSLDELKEKVDYYLNHPEERKAISEKGRKIVLESMTYREIAARLALEMEGIVSQSIKAR